jgi:hypothetical protein
VRIRSVAVVALGYLVPAAARADEVDVVPDDCPAPEPPAPPEGFGALHELRADDYERKNEGGYFTGVPIANYDPTTLVGFGGRVYYYWNGYRPDPRFAYTPYLHRVIAQAFFSTGSAQDQGSRSSTTTTPASVVCARCAGTCRPLRGPDHRAHQLRSALDLHAREGQKAGLRSHARAVRRHRPGVRPGRADEPAGLETDAGRRLSIYINFNHIF